MRVATKFCFLCVFPLALKLNWDELIQSTKTRPTLLVMHKTWSQRLDDGEMNGTKILNLICILHYLGEIILRYFSCFMIVFQSTSNLIKPCIMVHEFFGSEWYGLFVHPTVFIAGSNFFPLVYVLFYICICFSLHHMLIHLWWDCYVFSMWLYPHKLN